MICCICGATAVTTVALGMVCAHHARELVPLTVRGHAAEGP